MKHLLLSILILFISCSSSDEPAVNSNNDNNQNQNVSDDYKLVAVNSEGGIFEIGNNTGTISQIGQINAPNNLLILSSVVNFDTKILSIEANVSLSNVIFEYDKANNSTTNINLNIPTSVTSSMNEAFVGPMTFDGSSILAVVNENLPNNTHPSKLIAIDPQTYAVTDLNISFYQVGVTSIIYANSKLYMSTMNNGILEVDINLKTVTAITTNVGTTRLTKIDNTILAYNQLGGTNWINAMKPYQINLTNNIVTDKSQNIFYSLGNTTGNGFYINSEVLNIVFKQNNDFGLLKQNYNSNEINFISLDENIIGVNSIIIDTKSL